MNKTRSFILTHEKYKRALGFFFANKQALTSKVLNIFISFYSK